MSKFDANPFEDDASNNPFSASQPAGRSAAPAATTGSYFDTAAGAADPTPISSSGGDSSSRLNPLPPESRKGSAFDAAGDMPFSPKSLRKKQKELQAREAQLRKKEKELSSREENLGLARPNFPPLFPLIRHNIAEDIPEHLRSIQRLAFVTWLGAMFALCFNLLSVVLAWILGAVDAFSGIGCFFMAVVLVILGVPLSYFLWYRRLYNSFKNDSSIGLVFFFISYTSHICWFTLFAIAPPIFFGGYFMCGVLTTIGIFSGGNVFIGIMYTVGAGLFISVVALSVVVIMQVYGYFRGTGKANKLKQEAAMAALRNTVESMA